MSKLEKRCAELISERDELTTELQELDAQHERALAKVIEKREELQSSNVALITQVEVLKQRLEELESASVDGTTGLVATTFSGEKEYHQIETQTDGNSNVVEMEKEITAKQKSLEVRHAQLEADVAKAEQRLHDAQVELETIVAEQQQQQQHLQDLLVQQKNVTAQLTKVGADGADSASAFGGLDSTRTEPEGANVEESCPSRHKVSSIEGFANASYINHLNEKLILELDLVKQKLNQSDELRAQNEKEISDLNERISMAQSELADMKVSGLKSNLINRNSF